MAEKLVIEAWNDIKNKLPNNDAKEKLKKLAEYNVGRSI